jgi:hypothetical protein
VLSLRPWHVVVAFSVLQLLAVLLFGNGAFQDEGIYVIAGTDALQGRADFPPYVTWLDGSPFLFPLLSGAAYLAAGLSGSRLLTALFWALGLLFFARFVQGSFGRVASRWATLLLCLNGVFFSVAHLAVYDALAFFAFTACLWSAQRLVRSRSSVWVGRVSFWAALALVSKYSAIVLLLLAVPLTAFSSRRPYWRAIFICIAATAVLALTYVIAAHGQLFPAGALAILITHVRAGDRLQIVFELTYLLVVPLSLAVIAARHLHGHRARFAWLLIACSLVWPLLHTATLQNAGLYKHAALSLVFLYPLVGWQFARWWRARRRLAYALSAACVLWGVAQTAVLDHCWLDIRPLADFLMPRLHRDDKVGMESAWDVSLYAVLGGASKPERFFNGWMLRQQRQAPCELSWIIGNFAGAGGPGTYADRTPQVVRPSAPGSGADDYARAAERCGFQEVARFPSERYVVAPPLFRRSYEQLVVYRNPAPRRASEVP